jgi:uracil-DNA glycosylase
VFGEGKADEPPIMFVGEGPGANEDASGRPFVGDAGQLLDRMIDAMGLRRDGVYIANVVKCRPPGNADPTDAQVQACRPYLFRQVEVIRPAFLVALGRTAAGVLSGGQPGVVRLRGRVLKCGDIPLVVTYHPAALLRDPSRKRDAWEDLRMVMARLELKQRR